MIYVAASTENAIEKPQKCIMNPVVRAQTGAEMLPMEKKALNAATRSSSPTESATRAIVRVMRECVKAP